MIKQMMLEQLEEIPMSEVEYETPAGTYQLEHSRYWLRKVHDESLCAGRPCTIHNRTDHPMRDFPQNWRVDYSIMERICPHGIGHPDPDEYKLTFNKWENVHGCDGCCNQ